MFAYLTQSMGATFTTIEEWAASMYEYKPTTYSLRIRRNGEEWKDVTQEAYWEKAKAKYTINENGTYEIELKLDDKVGIKTIEVNSISKLGKYVKYKDIYWKVLWDEENRLELISADALGSVTIGSTKYAEGREQYNKLVENLVNECKEETGITENIRNVGGPSFEDKLSDDNTVKFVDITNFKPDEGVSFSDFEGIDNGLRKGDENYLDDYNQMNKIGIVVADNSEKYCFTSRWVDDHQGNMVYFRVRYCNVSVLSDEQITCSIYKDATGIGTSYINSYGVRPVISLIPGSLDEATGSGLKNDPIIIN